ncbi:MAG: hypothetical protein ACR2L9_03940, partial [Solirubrobacteraceae bacterium]
MSLSDRRYGSEQKVGGETEYYLRRWPRHVVVLDAALAIPRMWGMGGTGRPGVNRKRSILSIEN